MSGNYEWDKPRWIIHDPNDHFAGEFQEESEAISACKRWNEHGGNLVVMSWDDAPEGSDDSHRGFYTIRVTGTDFKYVVACGWHSMEAAADMVEKLRDAVAEHGINAGKAFLSATRPYMQ